MSKATVRPLFRVAASFDYRGLHDDELCFLFRGVSVDMVVKAFQRFMHSRYGIAAAARVYTEDDIVRRNGYAHSRVVLHLIRPHYDLFTFDSIKMLVEWRIRQEINCRFVWMSDSRFLNC